MDTIIFLLNILAVGLLFIGLTFGNFYTGVVIIKNRLKYQKLELKNLGFILVGLLFIIASFYFTILFINNFNKM